LKGHRADELSTPEFSFHRCRASREVEGHGANPNTISPEKYNGGERITTATATTFNRNSKKNQHEDSRISLDSSRRTPTDRRFAPLPNNILAGYVVTKDFNFVIAKISVTTEITEFREIRPKFRRIFFRD
jgi:hypothetical protein